MTAAPSEPAAPDAAGALSDRTVLVTGGAGYIAASLLQLLLPVPCTIRRVLRPGQRSAPFPGRGRVEDTTGELQDPGLWRELVSDVDVVFHLAAQTSTYVANADPAADLAANVLPAVHLLEACRTSGRSITVVLAGSATQVGLPARVPVDVTPPDRPATIYDLHKLVTEQYLEHYVRLGAVTGTCLRLANVYGPGPESSSADRGVLNMMIRRALRGEPLTVYGDGEYIRDYVHVYDVARAFLVAAARPEQLSGRHFVIGSGVGTRIVDAIRLVAQRTALRTGAEAPVMHVAPPAHLSPIEHRNFVADTSAFTAATGWRPQFDLTAGIDHTIAAYLEGGRAEP